MKITDCQKSNVINADDKCEKGKAQNKKARPVDEDEIISFKILRLKLPGFLGIFVDPQLPWIFQSMDET